jgi:hypothetical protein
VLLGAGRHHVVNSLCHGTRWSSALRVHSNGDFKVVLVVAPWVAGRDVTVVTVSPCFTLQPGCVLSCFTCRMKNVCWLRCLPVCVPNSCVLNVCRAAGTKYRRTQDGSGQRLTSCSGPSKLGLTFV